MSKFCPTKNGPALYLDCMECEDKVCELKSFQTEMEAVAYGLRSAFTMYSCERVLIDNKPTYLCGSNKVYEEKLWGMLHVMFKHMADTFHIDMDTEGEASSMRDHILDQLEKNYGLRFVEVYKTY